MNEFFKVYEIAAKKYGLERRVNIDLEEAKIRIYENDKIIIRVDGEAEDIESVYLAAALRLFEWMENREKNETSNMH